MVGQLTLSGGAQYRFAVFGIDEDQVNVGGDIEFMSAQLAHANDDHLLRLARFVTGWRAMAGAHFCVQCMQVDVDRKFSKIRYRFENFCQIGALRQIAYR